MVNVSVIIPTYNSAKYLPEAIDSVLNQTYQDFEIIIIDDGSTDNTREIVNNYINSVTRKLGNSQTSIFYFYQANQGQAVARNLGIRNARGMYIALLDADDLFLSTRIEEGVKILDSYEDVGLVHSNLTIMYDNGRLPFTPIRKKEFLSGYIFNHLLIQKAHVSCPTVIFRKGCFDDVGGFDENMTRLGSEDRDLWVRITKKYKAFYLDKTLANYRVHSNNFTTDRDKILKGWLYIIDKYCPPSKREFNYIRSLAFSKVYKELGDDYLHEYNFKDARKHYLKALAIRPFFLWSWVNLCKAFLKIKVK